MEIRILFNQGKSIREISRELGISRNTVRCCLRSDKTEPSYKQRPKKPVKLDPFKAYIRSRLEAAAPEWIPATVIFREIQSRGYSGGQSMVRIYMRSIKPVKQEETIVRYETAPGVQMQVDWCVIRRGKHPLSAFIATLGFSRACYVEFVHDEKFETLEACHTNAFDFFEGVPKEVLYDNMRTVVTQRNAYGEGQHRFHKGLWQYAKEYGFVPRLCKPYRAQTKGKVERFIHYLRNSFYIPLWAQLKQVNLHADLDTLNVEVKKWLRDVAHQRIHGTTKETPENRLIEERKHLGPIPERAIIKPLEQPGADVKIDAVTKYPVEQLQRSPSSYDCFIQEYR